MSPTKWSQAARRWDSPATLICQIKTSAAAGKETNWWSGRKRKSFLNIVTGMCHLICLSRYCGTMNISQSIKGKLARKKGLNVSFTSNKKKSGGGAQCTAECIDPAPTTSTTTTTTTTNNLLCGHDVGSLPSSSMRDIKSQGSTYFIMIFSAT